ncbi:MAG TPA: CoA-binding protein [Candidatus Deferrimicrobium sp.]|nr:CoA-binding protein [Candidatus Deferrimicrobium sp.]
MEINSFFNPRSVVICGASNIKGKFGNQIIRNLRNIGYKGKIYLVNPNREEILGIKTYKSIKELPEIPDLGIVVLNPEWVMKAVTTCTEFGIKNIMVEASFLDAETEARLTELTKKDNVRIIGSNTIGIINFSENFTTSIIPVRCNFNGSGRIGYIAASGGLAGGCGWWSPNQEIGFSKIAHLGKACDVKEYEVLQYLIEDPATDVILLHLIRLKQQTLDTIALNHRKKPILFLKPNQSTHCLAVEKSGAIPVDTYHDLFEMGKAFLQAPLLQGDRIGLVGPSSGALALISTKLPQYGFELGALSEETKRILREKVIHSNNLDPKLNPVDYWPPTRFEGTEVGEKYSIATRALLNDENIDGVIIVLEIFKEIEFDVVHHFGTLRKEFPNKPIVVACIQVERPALQRIIDGLDKINMLYYVQDVERAVKALWTLRTFQKFQIKDIYMPQ